MKISDSITKGYKKIENPKLSTQQKKEILDSLFTLTKELQNPKLRKENLSKLANYYFANYNQKDVRKTSIQLLREATETKDTLYLAHANRYLASDYREREIYDSAFYHYVKAEKFYKAINDKENYAYVLYSKAYAQHLIGEFNGAELNLSLAANYYKSVNDYQNLQLIYNEQGRVARDLREYDRALEYFNKALENAKKIPNEKEESFSSICLSNIGVVYQDMRKYNEAINYYKKALYPDNKLINNNPVLYSNVVDNMAFCKLQIKDFTQLPDLFYEALQIRETNKNMFAVTNSYMNLSKYYLKINQIKEAKKYAFLALSTSKKTGVVRDIMGALQQASEVDVKNAFKYSEEYIALNDSLQILERKNKDHFARIQLETDEIIQEKGVIEKEKNYILVYLFISVLFGIGVYIIKNQIAKTKELEYKQAQQKANEDIYKLIISQQSKIDEGKDVERKRIAKEIHDGLLGRIFGLRFNLDSLNYDNTPEAIQHRLQYINELKIIENDLREISHELSRENESLINNFLAIVNNLLQDQKKINTAKLTVNIDKEINWDNISNVSKINIYRILQESLQNINKYAQATLIKIEFFKDKNSNLVLKISDNGIGFNSNKKSKGIGIKNMNSRAKESGGIFEIKSEKGKGTVSVLVVPFKKANNKDEKH
ncbi:signal transduction histidine kinase [Flavobacterium croceum DSM 17960]|uniref:histidine kinase n=1 Tax=Flavobacterium croceum DSM 17960 TaxID=1121886 RepID=A0A2S4N5M7_9FLAO|nr:tetratricopeptide repeat-containing sensor histidine kinase [Flavobacterium croceum]POS00986.1 signal transduction histidine kinase [Flavobacterium croceum DSM 17960]